MPDEEQDEGQQAEPETDESQEDTGTSDQETQDPDPAALQRLADKNAREAGQYRKKLRAAEALIEQSAAAERTELENEKATSQKERERADRLAQRLVASAVIEAATGKLADPKAAVRLIGVDITTLMDDDGEPDMEAINAAIDAALDEFPNLREGKKPKFEGDADAGPRGSGAEPKDLGALDMEEYRKARRAGGDK